MVEQHDAPLRTLLASFPETVELEVGASATAVLSRVAPQRRGDRDVVTPEARLAEALAGANAGIVAAAHTHVSSSAGFRDGPLQPRQRRDAVEGTPGACWAMLGSAGPNGPSGPSVSVIEHRRTAYDLDEAERRYRVSGDPMTDEIIDILRQPPAPAEVIAHAEALAFSG